jgi:hypothetical protein
MAIRRMALVLAATALVSVLAASAASAGKPIREPLFVEDMTLTDICPFPVLVEFTASNEYVTFFEDGRLLITGKLFVHLTNANDTSNTLDLNISGPAMFTPSSEKYAGRGVFILFPEDVDGPGLILTVGRVDVLRAEDGFVTNYTVKGRTVDVCAALA